MAPPGLEQSLHPSSPGRGCGGARHPGTTRRPVLSWQSNLLRLTGLEVVEHHIFRVTRNTDIEVEEDRDEDLLQALELELARRRFGPPVRLEIADTTS